MQTIYFETTHFIRHTGNLVDLTEYRRKLEQIRQEEQGETESTAGQAATEYPAPRRRARRVSMAADWVASAAIVVTMFTFLVKIL